MYVVYALVDPRENTAQYVGMTDNPQERYISHLKCTGNNAAKNEWIDALRVHGYLPYMQTLEVISTLDLARKREGYWIQHYLYLNPSLLNIAHPAHESPWHRQSAVINSHRKAPFKSDTPCLSEEASEKPLPELSEEDEQQIMQIARAQLATYGRVIRSKIPAAMTPPRNNAVYPAVKALLDREGL